MGGWKRRAWKRFRGNKVEGWKRSLQNEFLAIVLSSSLIGGNRRDNLPQPLRGKIYCLMELQKLRKGTYVNWEPSGRAVSSLPWNTQLAAGLRFYAPKAKISKKGKIKQQQKMKFVSPEETEEKPRTV